MPTSVWIAYACSCAYARSLGAWRKSSVSSLISARDHRDELQIEHEQGERVKHDRDSRTNWRKPAGRYPRRQRERHAGGEQTRLDAEIEPEHAFQTRGPRNVTQREAAPAQRTHNHFGGSPCDELQCEMAQEWRGHAPQKDERSDSSAADQRARGPEQKPDEVTLRWRSL